MNTARGVLSLTALCSIASALFAARNKATFGRLGFEEYRGMSDAGFDSLVRAATDGR